MDDVTPLPPWGVILMHVGACGEAIRWASRRPVSLDTIQACRPDWVDWLRERVHAKKGADWRVWRAALAKALSGSGYGSGSGAGDGSGYGSGSGAGDGSGYGDGYGDGFGYGSGYGYGDGDGSGYGDE